MDSASDKPTEIAGSESETETEKETESASETEIGATSDAEVETESTSDAEMETETESASETETEKEPESASETESASEAETESEQASETESEQASETASFKAMVWRDVKRMAALALLGCAFVAVFEFVAALLSSPAPDVRPITAARLILIDVTLISLLWVALVPLLSGAALAARLVAPLHARQSVRTWPGLLAPDHTPSNAFQPAASWIWAGVFGVVLYVASSAYLTFRFITYFKEPQLTSLLLAVIQVGLFALVCAKVYVWHAGLRRAGQALHRQLGDRAARFNPLGRTIAAVIPLIVIALLAIKLAIAVAPQLEPKIPWRLLLAAVVFSAGAYVAWLAIRRRGHLLPRRGTPRVLALAAAALMIAVIVPVTLLRVGADHEAKSVAMTGSPIMLKVIDALRSATDFDSDGFGFLLGENDCDPFDGAVHPLARDIADNGVDEDCNGRDFSFKTPPKYKKGQRMAVPDEFKRDWNFLMITVDTVRYDHTGFGGYIEKRGRDTTPNLDLLVDRSVSFTFSNAPSAGTMASIPAILTSKFFHSGIALDENVKPRMPPRMRPENTLISELLKQKGYYNGAILTHEYFNDWGMEQGFDTYDNQLGKTHAPFKITSHDVTDKAIAWVARNAKRKWFLWLHYIDPHGRYVAHPGERSFGATEEDLYDGELFYTDKHLGRLMRELSRMPGADRTVILLTSDHGDAFNEHGFINHGQALYRELLHVPLIVYIPDLAPREVDGATSPLDLFPTICDLAGIDTSGMRLEGESLVPQLFYGKDANDRVVFAETNWPRPLRAAVTSSHKLVYKLKSNTYEFYDLKTDPWEQRNIYNSADKQALGEMKEYLDDWLERVYFSRDTVTNQAAAKLAAFLIDRPPNPKFPARDVTFDDGRIEIIGLDTNKTHYKAGETIQLSVYFRANDRPSGDFRLSVEAWVSEQAEPDDPAARRPRNARNPKGPRYTAEGLFATSRWRQGEHIRDRFMIKLPRTWRVGTRLAIGFGVTGADRKTKLPITGPSSPRAPGLVVLGEVGFTPAGSPPGVKPRPVGPPTQPAPKGQAPRR